MRTQSEIHVIIILQTSDRFNPSRRDLKRVHGGGGGDVDTRVYQQNERFDTHVSRDKYLA